MRTTGRSRRQVYDEGCGCWLLWRFWRVVEVVEVVEVVDGLEVVVECG